MDLRDAGVTSQIELDQLDTKERVVQAYVKIATTAKKPSDRIRALDKIAEMRGFKIEVRQVSDFRDMSPEQLEQLIEELILPSLAPYGVYGVKRRMKDDVSLDD